MITKRQREYPGDARLTKIGFLLLSTIFIISLVLVIASFKYADWAAPLLSGRTDGSSIILILYAGTVPLFTFTWSSVLLINFELDLFPYLPNAFSTSLIFLIIAAAQVVGWLMQSVFGTMCELAPVAQGQPGRVPPLCPQQRFRDPSDGNFNYKRLAVLAEVKPILSWVILVLMVGYFECARRAYVRYTQIEVFGMDELYELEESGGDTNQKEIEQPTQPTWNKKSGVPSRTPILRGYETKFDNSKMVTVNL